MGQFFAQMFEKQTIDPMRKEVEGFDDTIEKLQSRIKDLNATHKDQMKELRELERIQKQSDRGARTSSISSAVSGNFGAASALGGGLGSIAAFFSGIYSKRVIDPLTRQVSNFQSHVEKLKGSLERIKDVEGNEERRLQIKERIDQLISNERDATNELIQKQKIIADIQKKQESMAILDQQMKLIELIREYKLNPQDILGDLKLGVKADIPQLLARLNEAMGKVVKEANKSLMSEQDQQVARIDNWVERLKKRIQGDITENEREALEERLNKLIAKREAAMARIAEEEARVLAIQEKQQQISFLEQQMKLLDFIKQYGLDAGEILGGIEFGLDANLPDLLDAMAAAMQKVIEAANQELGIASPSKVFRRIFENVMATATDTVNSLSAMPARAMQTAMTRVTSVAGAMSAAPLAGSVSNRTMNVNFGGVNMSGGMDVAVLEHTIRRVVRSELGGTT